MEPVFSFPLALPPRGQGLVTQALHQQLRSAILDGRLPSGLALPATRRVAAALGIARNTVVAAYELLVAEGYVMPRKGARAVIADVATRHPARARHAVPNLGDARLNPAWRTPLAPAAVAGPAAARSFRLGMPEDRRFPHAIWRRLVARSMRSWARDGFHYPPSEGVPELRDAIAQHVAFTRAVACSSDDMVVTAGAQQAFDLLARTLVTPGRTHVAVEEPGYPPLRAAFAAAGAQLVPVAVDDHGLCVAQLPPDVRVICVTPSHQSPTGVALSLQRRTALLDFARRRGAVVIEDDYDGEFRFGGRPLDALQTLDRDATVFYVGTFSKSMYPSLRQGFVVAPAWARDALVAVKQCIDPHCDSIMQSALAAFIREGHLARHVRRMQAVYAARRRALLDGLQRDLAAWLQPIPSEAGLHLAARIREPALAGTVIAQARRHTPGAQSIAEYTLAGPAAEPALAFGYGAIDATDIAPALARLRRALQR